jgi:hypothetical protein
MQFPITTAIIVAFLPYIVLGAPAVTPRQTDNAALAAAADNWSVDIVTVSHFLDAAAGGALTGQPLQDAATLAFNAEVNELTRPRRAIQEHECRHPGGRLLLVGQMKFQFVLDGLSMLTTPEAGALQSHNVAAMVVMINNNRCANVLPAIDTYFRVTATFLGNPDPVFATRPIACT